MVDLQTPYMPALRKTSQGEERDVREPKVSTVKGTIVNGMRIGIQNTVVASRTVNKDPYEVLLDKNEQKFWNRIPDDEPFKKFLQLRGVSARTAHSYYMYVLSFNKELPLLAQAYPEFNQVSALWYWDNHKRSNPVQFALKAYAEFLNNHYGTDLVLKFPRITGHHVQRKIPVLTEEEVSKMAELLRKLDASQFAMGKTNKFYVAFLLTYDLALRKNELLYFTVNQMKWQAWLTDMTKRCEVRIIGKGNKERKLSLSPEVARIVITYAGNKQRYFEDKILGGRLMNKKEADEFRSRPLLEPMGSYKWMRVLNKVGRKAIGKKVKPHILRASRLTHLKVKGVDIYTLKELAGHSSLTTTESYIRKTGVETLTSFENIDNNSIVKDIALPIQRPK